MKKVVRTTFLMTVFLLIVSIGHIYAQAALFVLIFGDKVATEKFHLSLDIGLNVAGTPGLENGKVTTGLNFGLGTHLMLGEHWSFAPEFKPLSKKGVEDIEGIVALPNEINVDKNGLKSDIQLNYIEVPILFQYKPLKNLYLSMGPQFSFLVSANQNTVINLDDGTTLNIDKNIRSEFNAFDWSFPVEVGYMIRKKDGGRAFDIRARYSYGFNEILKSDVKGPSTHHSVFQFIATFPFINTED